MSACGAAGTADNSLILRLVYQDCRGARVLTPESAGKHPSHTYSTVIRTYSTSTLLHLPNYDFKPILDSY